MNGQGIVTALNLFLASLLGIETADQLTSEHKIRTFLASLLGIETRPCLKIAHSICRFLASLLGIETNVAPAGEDGQAGVFSVPIRD